MIVILGMSDSSKPSDNKLSPAIKIASRHSLLLQYRRALLMAKCKAIQNMVRVVLMLMEKNKSAVEIGLILDRDVHT